MALRRVYGGQGILTDILPFAMMSEPYRRHVKCQLPQEGKHAMKITLGNALLMKRSDETCSQMTRLLASLSSTAKYFRITSNPSSQEYLLAVVISRSVDHLGVEVSKLVSRLAMLREADGLTVVSNSSDYWRESIRPYVDNPHDGVVELAKEDPFDSL